MCHWAPVEWGLAIRQARSANLLGALGVLAESVDQGGVPEMAAKHFQAARNVTKHRNSSVLWECRQLCETLGEVRLQPIFLKGAAYVLAGLPLARHRHFADIDLMVPWDRLGEAETQLMISGWLTTHPDPYDQHYYRKWMHEIPPLRHIRRGTTVDVHHAITPRTAKYCSPAETLFAAAVPVPRLAGAYVLAPTDMILHAAVHLFSEGEADNALRNLVDVDELLTYYYSQSGFHVLLVERAFALGLARPLFYAVHFLRKLFGRPSLDALADSLESAAPGKTELRLIEAIYTPVFLGMHPSVARPMDGISRTALYWRGHWLRMPAHLLLPHLLRKLLKARQKPRKTEAEK